MFNFDKKIYLSKKLMEEEDLSIREKCIYIYKKNVCAKKNKKKLSKSNSDFYDLNELKYYCVVSNQELMDFIQCGKTKIIQIKNNLEKIGLIKQIRQMDKSNKIFVNDYKIQ